jgi:GntR family transcriptional regulator, transcriptional repressor for pyruvate dehydrogenase complex
MNQLRAVSRTTLSEQVAIELASALSAKRWGAGDKLPSEAELCKIFKVGRSTLREALTSLSFIGLIRMRPGEGSYVCEQPSKYLDGPLLAKGTLKTGRAVNELSEARLVLETETAALCAERATDQDLQALEEILDQMGSAKDGDPDQFCKFDLAFHLALAAGSKNDILAGLLKRIRSGLHELIAKSLLLAESRDLAYKQHRLVMVALKQRDSEAARKAIRSHLLSYQRGYKVVFQMPQEKTDGKGIRLAAKTKS